MDSECGFGVPTRLGLPFDPSLLAEGTPARTEKDKFGIYDGLGIGEVWRHDGERLRTYVRGSEGGYSERDRSALFPLLSFYRWVEEEGKRGE